MRKGSEPFRSDDSLEFVHVLYFEVFVFCHLQVDLSLLKKGLIRGVPLGLAIIVDVLERLARRRDFLLAALGREEVVHAGGGLLGWSTRLISWLLVSFNVPYLSQSSSFFDANCDNVFGVRRDDFSFAEDLLLLNDPRSLREGVYFNLGLLQNWFLHQSRLSAYFVAELP